MQGQYKNDLVGLQFQSQYGSAPIPGEQILRENFQVESKWNQWWDLSVVFLFVFVFRGVFFITIKSLPHVQAFYTKFRTRRNVSKDVI